MGQVVASPVVHSSSDREMTVTAIGSDTLKTRRTLSVDGKTFEYFSLVAAEMVSGEYGLGYVINTAYSMIQYPTIAIGMITLGVIGYISSAIIRLIGRSLMEWRARELSAGGG